MSCDITLITTKNTSVFLVLWHFAYHQRQTFPFQLCHPPLLSSSPWKKQNTPKNCQLLLPRRKPASLFVAEETGFHTEGRHSDWNKGPPVLARRYKTNSLQQLPERHCDIPEHLENIPMPVEHDQLYNIQKDIPQTCTQLEGRLLILKYIKKRSYVSVKNHRTSTSNKSSLTTILFLLWAMRDNKSVAQLPLQNQQTAPFQVPAQSQRNSLSGKSTLGSWISDTYLT